MKLAICGCGIGGLASAILAHRAGFQVTLFDQFDTPAPVGSGLVIQPVGLRVLEHLGAADAAILKGAKGFDMIGHEAKSKLKVLDVSYGPVGGDKFGLGIHRSSLFGVLFDAAKSEGISITSAHRVLRSTVQDDGRYIHFKDGQISGPYDLVVDATGAGSPLSPLKSKALPYGAIWGTVDWPKDCDMRYDRLQQRYRRASNMIGILPIGTLPDDDTPKAALFWSLPRNDIPNWRKTSLTSWRKQATDLWPQLAPFTDQIQNHDQMTPAVYTHGSLSQVFTPRLVHIGDAAHRASPQLGQGANMALLDAYALVKSLEAYPVNAALTHYANARRLHTNFYQAMSWAFTPMYQSDSRALPILRDFVLGPLSKAPPIPKFLTSLVKGTFINPTSGLDF